MRKHRKLSALCMNKPKFSALKIFPLSDTGPLILISPQIQRWVLAVGSARQQKSRLLAKAAEVSEMLRKLFDIAPQRLSESNDAINFFTGQ
jgi:hypothetical protein